MNIIIVGIGKTGSAVMRQLIADGHSVTVIDTDQNVLDRANDIYDMMSYRGSGMSFETLNTAGARQADMLLSFTGSDDTNLLCCLAARKLNPRLHTIPRIRDQVCLDLAGKLRSEFGISLVVNPDRAAAREIYMLLQFPEFLKRDTFAGRRVEIVQLRVKENSKLNGATINGLSALTGCKVLVCAIVRDGEAFIPKGDGVLEEGDNVYVTAKASVLRTLISNLGIQTRRLRHLMIVGGDRSSVYLARMLAESKVNIKIIENDPARAAELTQALPFAKVQCADGSLQEVLDRESLASMDGLVTLTGFDEVNMVISMYGLSQGVSGVITKINRIESPALLSGLNVGGIINVTQMSTRVISKYVRAVEKKSGAAQSVHPIANGQVEAMEFVLDDTARHCGKPLMDVPIRSDILLACIIHEDETIIPDGQSRFTVGDTVVVVAPANGGLEQFNDIFV